MLAGSWGGDESHARRARGPPGPSWALLQRGDGTCAEILVKQGQQQKQNRRDRQIA